MISRFELSVIDGKVVIGGKEVGVSFNDGSDRSNTEYTEPSSLVIRGLTLVEALDLLSLVKTPVAAPVGVPAHNEARVVDEKARADAALAKAREAAKVVAVAVKPVEKPVEVVDDDLEDSDEDEDEDSGSPMLDIAAMNKMDKLRGIIEYMVKAGFTTPEQIVAAAVPIKSDVKTLKILDEKGQFEKRLERAAMTVLAPADAT
jgi:hypothetical protein